MTRNISNKTLIILLIAAIFISVGSTLIGVTKLSEIDTLREISGFGTIGEVNVTITSQIALNVTFTSINFGSGYVNPGESYACLESESGKATGWSSATTKNSSLIVENVGNTDLNVTFNMDKTTQVFIGGTNPRLEIKSSSNASEPNSCDPAGTKGGLGALAAYTAIVGNNENRSVCNNLTSVSTADSLTINANVTIPADAQGVKGVMLTFEGSIPM